MDFYERGLYNHILAVAGSRDRHDDLLLPVPARRVQDVLDAERFVLVLRRAPGMENHAKYSDTIYFHDDGALYVNLFIPSELTWKDKGSGAPTGDAVS